MPSAHPDDEDGFHSSPLAWCTLESVTISLSSCVPCLVVEIGQQPAGRGNRRAGVLLGKFASVLRSSRRTS